MDKKKRLCSSGCLSLVTSSNGDGVRRVQHVGDDVRRRIPMMDDGTIRLVTPAAAQLRSIHPCALGLPGAGQWRQSDSQ